MKLYALQQFPAAELARTIAKGVEPVIDLKPDSLDRMCSNEKSINLAVNADGFAPMALLILPRSPNGSHLHTLAARLPWRSGARTNGQTKQDAEDKLHERSYSTVLFRRHLTDTNQPKEIK